jgi:hypothetical protein
MLPTDNYGFTMPRSAGLKAAQPKQNEMKDLIEYCTARQDPNHQVILTERNQTCCPGSLVYSGFTPTYSHSASTATNVVHASKHLLLYLKIQANTH